MRTGRLGALAAAMLVVALILTACGGGDEEGVELETVAQPANPTPLPTATPGAADAVTANTGLEGRLLYRSGVTLYTLDLATGESTPITDLKLASEGDGINVASTVFFNEDQTIGAFVAFPEFGVVNLTTNEVYEIDNTGSNPSGFGLSPDGRWLAALTGSFQLRLQLLAADGSARHNVAASSDAPLAFGWTSDSRLVWWLVTGDASEFNVFDPASEESSALEPGTSIVTYPPILVSPDKTRLVTVPLATNDADECFDSYIHLTDLPITTTTMGDDGVNAYTEPGLVAASPQWIDDDRVVFVRLGIGSCGVVEGDEVRELVMVDFSSGEPQTQVIAGPLGNVDDTNDFAQFAARQYGHLYSPSPDGEYVAWIGGGVAADESLLNITHLATGETQTVLRITKSEIGDAAQYIARALLRQVTWLE